MPTKVLVSDTNIWIDLHHGGLLETAFELPYQFVTTDFVWRELRRPPGADLESMGLLIEGLPKEGVKALYALRATLNNPSLADVSCYYLATLNQWTLLTGDGSIRRVCQAENLDVRGTLWVMDELFDQSVVTGPVLAEALQAMLDAGGRLPADECRARMAVWSE